MRQWWRNRKSKPKPQEGPNEYERFKTFPLWKKAWHILKLFLKFKTCIFGYHGKNWVLARTTTQERENTGREYRDWCKRCGRTREVYLSE